MAILCIIQPEATARLSVALDKSYSGLSFDSVGLLKHSRRPAKMRLPMFLLYLSRRSWGLTISWLQILTPLWEAGEISVDGMNGNRVEARRCFTQIYHLAYRSLPCLFTFRKWLITRNSDSGILYNPEAFSRGNTDANFGNGGSRSLEIGSKSLMQECENIISTKHHPWYHTIYGNAVCAESGKFPESDVIKLTFSPRTLL